MSSLLTSQGVVFATAMAVSGTMIFLATLRLQKYQEFSFNSIHHHSPRSCIPTDVKKKEKKKKRVKFAEDVVEPSGNSEEYRKLHHFNSNNFRHENTSSCSSNLDSNELKSGKVQEMSANRAALYNAMLKGRVINRVTYSY